MSQNQGNSLQRSHFDQDPLNYGSQASTTTDSRSTVTTQAEAESPPDGRRDSMSAYSYRSDIDACRLLRRVDGRTFNSLNETYFMPSGDVVYLNFSAITDIHGQDDNEWVRLNKQHIALVLAFGGLCPAMDIIETILAPREGETKRILDIGSGTGVWTLDMAKKFPEAEVVGIDVAPGPVDANNLPPNCRFEIDDIELGLSHYWNQFDVVHARMITTGLKDSEKAMNDIYNCLKPGGIMIWIEVDHSMFTSDTHVYHTLGSDANPNGSWVSRIIYEMKRSATRVGQSDYTPMEKALDGGLWNIPLFDPETCKSASVYLPIGPWANHDDFAISQRLKYIGALMRQNVRELHTIGRLVLTKAGWPLETLTDWLRRAEEELSSMKTPIQTRLRVAWGRRRAAPGQPAPALSWPRPVTPPSPGDEDLVLLSAPYPFFYMYNTQGEALAEARLRNRSKDGFRTPPLPS